MCKHKLLIKIKITRETDLHYTLYNVILKKSYSQIYYFLSLYIQKLYPETLHFKTMYIQKQEVNIKNAKSEKAYTYR